MCGFGDMEEGVTKFMAEHRSVVLDAEMHSEKFIGLSSWREILFQLGFVGQDPLRYGGAGYGNMSARLPPYSSDRGKRRFIITGTQTSMHESLPLAKHCVVERYNVKNNSVKSVGQTAPSSESMTHGAIYDINPAIRFVFHGHVPIIWNNAKALRLPTSDPGVGYGTPEMAFEVGRLYRSSSMPDSKVFVMGGHEDGVIVFGRSPEEAGQIFITTLARALALQY